MDLQNILNSSKRQQWSVADFDWSTPVDMEGVSQKQQRNLAFVLLFISGVERAGAEFFRIHADYIDDPVASELFNVFAADEDRHADAEIEMAKRLGMQWHELPWITRLAFKFVNDDLEALRKSKYGPGIHRFGATMILFAELGLDGIVMPTLRKGMNEPLHDAVWKKIDQDERRHLAMDYWLIENRYERNLAHQKRLLEGATLPRAKRGFKLSIPLRSIILTPLIVIPGFLLVARAATALPVEASVFRRYWELVKAVPKKSPHATELASYNNPRNWIKNISLYFKDKKRFTSFVYYISSGKKLVRGVGLE
ncbi:MAG: hypothetical protein COB04_09385 [Gammaproteobacteria bacterium]|nr:MAG: hypothetical protein COB04_09385 [Gammaproteobacteria bacterium]